MRFYIIASFNVVNDRCLVASLMLQQRFIHVYVYLEQALNFFKTIQNSTFVFLRKLFRWLKGREKSKSLQQTQLRNMENVAKLIVRLNEIIGFINKSSSVQLIIVLLNYLLIGIFGIHSMLSRPWDSQWYFFFMTITHVFLILICTANESIQRLVRSKKKHLSLRKDFREFSQRRKKFNLPCNLQCISNKFSGVKNMWFNEKDIKFHRSKAK